MVLPWAAERGVMARMSGLVSVYTSYLSLCIEVDHFRLVSGYEKATILVGQEH